MAEQGEAQRSNTRTRSWWGWGWEEEALSDQDCRAVAGNFADRPNDPRPVPHVEQLNLPKPRVEAPDTLASFITNTPSERATHALGKAYRDVVRALNGKVGTPPDLVAYPASEAEVTAVLDWASDTNVAVIPYGGGSSVVGGVEYDGAAHSGVVSLDMTRMSRVLEIDEESRAARIQAGALGPVLEDQLRPHGYTLRHYPQSFEFSTLGGWLATRSGGHYATLGTHIDEFVESIRAVTPVGISESWRLPGSGAGPSPDRLMLGSEGILGVITEAWMRIQARPTHRGSASVTFGGDNAATNAMAAVRAVSQSGLYPANCRLLNPGEARLAGNASGEDWVLVLGVESAERTIENDMAQLLELVRDHGGTVAAPTYKTSAPATSAVANSQNGAAQAGRDQTADVWRSAFLRMPYVRDALARMSVIVETFETATTWDRVENLYDAVMADLNQAIVEITGLPGQINCRFTHVYPDGAAPYFSITAAGQPGSELSMWDEIKAASMEILTNHKATVTHHHAVGRDHRPGYDRQRPEPFAVALRAAKKALDPASILNPGVLIDP